MDKLKMQSANITEANVDKLAQLFPHCVTETRDAATGKVKRAIDFDLLRQDLSDHAVEGQQERYQLNWPGKREALITANTPINKTLRPCPEESVNFDCTKNLFIEGDNLEALKLLQETYLGKVKMIYIDPPYNTGNDFIYNDTFTMDKQEYDLLSGQRDEDGGRLVDEEKFRANTASNGRFHSDWLSMMYPRLKLAHNLLRDDGVIFISIDDNESANLRKVCDEIFGGDNFIAALIWKSRQIVDSRPQNNVSNDHEYILVYGKSQNSTVRGKTIDLGKYSNPDNDERGAWMSNSILGLANQSQRPNLHYNLINPETGLSYPCPADSGWRYSRETMGQKIQEKRIVFPTKPEGRPREKKFLNELTKSFTGFSSILSPDVGYTLHGTRELRDLLKENLFPFPKPTTLLREMIIQVVGDTENAIILDFFAGSGTTAHAVVAQNCADGGNRRYIAVQLPEAYDQKSEALKLGYKTIAEISKERIRRAGAKIKADNAGKEGIDQLDIGFRVLKIDSSNMAEVYYSPDALSQTLLETAKENIKPDRSAEDLLFQVMLDWGLDLALPITQEQIDGKTVFFVDDNALAACFDDKGGVDEGFVKQLATRQPLRVVFRDAGFKSDSVKINIEQIFKLLSPTTDIKTI